MEKRGQMKMSFGMIFSIILIVLFLAFSIYGIVKFLDFQKSVQIGQFTTYIQDDINKMWGGTQGSVDKEYRLPQQINYVCFYNLNSPGIGAKSSYTRDFELVSEGKNNFYFYPVGSGGDLGAKVIKHIDIAKITSEENPFCIPNTNGKIKMNIKMDLGDSLVSITR